VNAKSFSGGVRVVAVIEPARIPTTRKAFLIAVADLLNQF